MSDDNDDLLAPIPPVPRDIPPQHTEDVWHLIPDDDTVAPGVPVLGRPNTAEQAMRDLIGVQRAMLEVARPGAGDGWTHAPGDDPDLPDEVRDAVAHTIADTDLDVGPGDYWVMYQPAAALAGVHRDGYDILVTPASITRGPEVTTVDRAARMSHDLQHVTMAFVEAAEGITEGMRAVAEAAAPAAEAMARAWAPVGAAIARGFGTLVYVTDGPAPGPVVDEATALAALAYAESTRVVQHPRKGHRRNAKRAYLAVKRHLAPEHRARFRKVPMRQFGAL